jgi:hypothetical protein
MGMGKVKLGCGKSKVAAADSPVTVGHVQLRLCIITEVLSYSS